MQQGLYDTEGVLFGYVEGNAVFNLDGHLMGDIVQEGKRRVVYALDGEAKWHISGDGVFALNWEPVGYLGSPRRDSDNGDL